MQSARGSVSGRRNSSVGKIHYIKCTRFGK
jgi:hypothetical protein